MNWEDLLISPKNDRGNYVYQDCTATILKTGGDARDSKYGSFQDIFIQGRKGEAKTSLFIKKGDNYEIKFGEEVPLRAKVEPDDSNYNINGNKYTFMPPMTAKSGGGGGGRSFGKSAEERASIEHQKAYDLSQEIYKIAVDITKHNSKGEPVSAGNIREIANQVLSNISDNATVIVKWIKTP